MTSRTATRAATLTGLAAASLLLLAACGSNTSQTSSGTSGSGSAAATGKVAVGSTPVGKVLVDPQGMTLYVFANDTKGHSNCEGVCAQYWTAAPGADAGMGKAAGVMAALGTAKRTDGSSQLTVNGFPVYTFVNDHAAGQANGQGLNQGGGLWWVVSPSGTKITSASSSPSSSSGGGYGTRGGGGY